MALQFVGDLDSPQQPNTSGMSYEQYLRKYNVKDANNPLAHYDYKGAYNSGIVPVKWNDLSPEDKAEDLQQVKSGVRPPIDPNSYMWPDEYKTKENTEPRGKPTGGLTFVGDLSESTESTSISGGVFAPSSNDKEWGNMSKFQKFLDVIGRPGYAVKAALSEIARRDTAKLDGRPLSPEEKKGILTAAWEGLSGQERVTANKLWEQYGVKGIPLLGFATELVSDPLMYGGYSAVTKGITKVGTETLASVARQTPKIIAKFPAVEKVVEKAGDVLQPAGKLLRETFTTKSTVPALNNLIRKYLDERQYTQGKELEFGVDVNKAIKEIAKKTGKSIDEIGKEIINFVELSPKNPNIAVSTPEIKIIADKLSGHFSELLGTEQAAGVAVSRVGGELGYFPRVISKQAAGDYLRQATVGGKRIWNVKLANSLRRKTGDMTLEEFNAFVAAEGLPSLGGKTAEGFFSTNPGYVTALRGVRSTKAVTSAQFLNEAGGIFGRTAGTVGAEGWIELPEAVTKLNPALKGKVFDPEVAKEIQRVTVNYFDKAPLNDFLKVFDATQNVWKRWTLAVFPKYHLRNMVGNSWNNYLAGINPIYYERAAKLQRNPELNKEVIELAKKHGVINQGWFAADIEQAVEKQVAGASKSPTGVGMRVGTVIENNARLAHFMDRVARGLSPEDAAQSVKKFLFDYGDLTAFEKQFMKRIAPFYTWTRKNVPLQLENLWKQPEKYAVTTPLLRERNESDLLKLKLAQPSLYERFPIEFGRTKEAVAYIALEGLLPMGDLTKMVRPEEVLTELASPYIKTPVELLMNKNFYTEQQIQKYDGETQEILKLELPVKLQYALANLIPVARLAGEITNLTKKKRASEELTPGQKTFNFLLGKVYQIDTEDLRDRALLKIERDVEALRVGANKAKAIGREREYKKIMETIEKVRAMRDKIK